MRAFQMTMARSWSAALFACSETSLAAWMQHQHAEQLGSSRTPCAAPRLCSCRFSPTLYSTAPCQQLAGPCPIWSFQLTQPLTSLPHACCEMCSMELVMCLCVWCMCHMCWLQLMCNQLSCSFLVSQLPQSKLSCSRLACARLESGKHLSALLPACPPSLISVSAQVSCCPPAAAKACGWTSCPQPCQPCPVQGRHLDSVLAGGAGANGSSLQRQQGSRHRRHHSRHSQPLPLVLSISRRSSSQISRRSQRHHLCLLGCPRLAQLHLCRCPHQYFLAVRPATRQPLLLLCTLTSGTLPCGSRSRPGQDRGSTRPHRWKHLGGRCCESMCWCQTL